MPFDPYSLGKLMVRAEHFEFSKHVLLNVKEHIEIKETAGLPLIVFAVLGLIWSNLAFPGAYESVWDADLLLDVGIFTIGGHLKHIVNDLLLPLFFFVVGLEIKHELVRGELSSWRRAAMPLAVAAGGMLAPACIYLAFNASGGMPQGWGVPVATDVAFALAILAVFSDRIPHNLKVLTMAFATADDIGGALVIALFYSGELSLNPLLVAAAVYAVMLLFIRFRLFGGYIVYTVLGLTFFIAMLKSGIHTTIAGVLLGLAVPSRPVFLRESFSAKITELAGHFHETHAKRREIMAGPEVTREARLEAGDYSAQEQFILGKIDELVRGTESPCSRLRRMISPFVNYLVLPVFALANAGVVISSESLALMLDARPAWGIVAGLVAGKPLGVLTAAWLAQKTGLGQFPDGVGWRHVTGMALVAGVGFTVSLFIADLAFRGLPMAEEAKMGVMAASLIAAAAGMLYFSLAFKNHPGKA